MVDASAEPPPDCTLCPRLADYRAQQRVKNPDWFNAPVPDFGDPDAWLAVVGLAPGLTGANRTGRPFTGDHAGGFLYDALARFGFVRGEYGGSADDGLELDGVTILNAVRCVPPQNKPVGAEIDACRPFLRAALDRLPRLSTIVALGTIAHGSTLRGYGAVVARHPFGHGAEYTLDGGPRLISSYHCSRYNLNTGRLTPTMFDQIFARALELRG